jgi:hypothetical protein
MAVGEGIVLFPDTDYKLKLHMGFESADIARHRGTISGGAPVISAGRAATKDECFGNLYRQLM